MPRLLWLISRAISGWGRWPPLTSVRPHVGLEAVVVLVLLAADATFIGPWKTAGRAGKPPCHHEARTKCHWAGGVPWQTKEQ